MVIKLGKSVLLILNTGILEQANPILFPKFETETRCQAGVRPKTSLGNKIRARVKGSYRYGPCSPALMYASPLTKCVVKCLGKNRESCPFLSDFKMAALFNCQNERHILC